MRIKGVALISTLIMVGIASTIMAKIIVDEQLLMDSTRRITMNDQLFMYHMSLEDAAKVVLVLDSKDNRLDHKNELWNMPFTYPLNDTLVASINLTDAHATINLNNLQGFLASRDKEDSYTRHSSLSKGVAEVLESDGFDNGWDLTYTLVDWLDQNSDVSEGEGRKGAEGNSYLFLPIPYKPANDLMAHISELNLLMNFSKPNDELKMPFDTMIDNFTILPKSDTKINVNSIKCDARYLDAMFGQRVEEKRLEEDEGYISDSLASKVCVEEKEIDHMSGEEFDGEYYDSVDEFYSKINDELGYPPDSKSDWKAVVPANLFDVASDYFYLNTSFFLGDCTYSYKSLIYRRRGATAMKDVRVLSRELENVDCSVDKIIDEEDRQAMQEKVEEIKENVQ